MPRILSRHNVVVADEAVMATRLNQEQLNQDADRNTKLDTANTNLVNLKNQQDGIIGAINNTTIGDGTLGQRTYVYAHDVSNGQAKALKCDSAGRLECSVDALEVTAETINLNTDTMEAKLQAISDGQTQNGNGTGSKPGVLLDAIRTETVTGNSKLDTIITNTAAASSAGTATEAKQDTQITHLSEIEGAVEAVELTVGTNTATAPTRAIQIGGKYVDGTFRDIKVDNIGKVIVDSPAGSDINTRLDNIVNNTSSISDAEVHLSAIDTNIVNAEAHLGLIDSNMGQAELHLSALDTNFSNRIPTTIGPKDESLSFTICRNNTTGAFDTHARTDITDRATSKALLCNSAGRLQVDVVSSASTATYSSEVPYQSSQSVSGSGGTHTGSTVANNANIAEYIFEHNFSGSDVSYEIEESIDNSSFFNALGVSFNEAGSPVAANQGLNRIEIISPFFRVKFTNANASSRDVVLSFVSITK